MKRKFVPQFGFVALTGSLHLLPSLQRGEVAGDMGQGSKFNITGGVRQKVRAKSTFVLFRVAMGDARMEGRSRKCRFQTPREI